MTFNCIARAFVMFAVSVCACAQGHRHTTRIEPSYSFALLDKKLTLLDQQQTSLADDDIKPRIAAAHSIKRTAASIQRTAFRLQRLYERRHERFGAQTFRALRLRATAVQRAANSLEFARNTRAREAELKVLNTRILALIRQFQAVSGGYSALRCEPTAWTCCSPKRKLDLRPGESVACRWMCVPTAAACRGFRGPRLRAR
jgi:hypothetical protein